MCLWQCHCLHLGHSDTWPPTGSQGNPTLWLCGLKLVFLHLLECHFLLVNSPLSSVTSYPLDTSTKGSSGFFKDLSHLRKRGFTIDYVMSGRRFPSEMLIKVHCDIHFWALTSIVCHIICVHLSDSSLSKWFCADIQSLGPASSNFFK